MVQLCSQEQRNLHSAAPDLGITDTVAPLSVSVGTLHLHSDAIIFISFNGSMQHFATAVQTRELISFSCRNTEPVCNCYTPER